MDSAKRTSFDNPLIAMVSIALSWMAVTGLWLLFGIMRRHHFAWLRR